MEFADNLWKHKNQHESVVRSCICALWMCFFSFQWFKITNSKIHWTNTHTHEEHWLNKLATLLPSEDNFNNFLILNILNWIETSFSEKNYKSSIYKLCFSRTQTYFTPSFSCLTVLNTTMMIILIIINSWFQWTYCSICVV